MYQQNWLGFSSLSLVYGSYEHVPISYGGCHVFLQLLVTVENDGFSIWYLWCLLFNWCPSISSKFFLVSIHPSKVFWTFKLVSSKNVPDFLVNFIKKVLMPEFSYQLALQIFRGDSFYFPYTLIWREHQLKWTLTMLYLQVANQYGQWCCHFSGEVNSDT